MSGASGLARVLDEMARRDVDVLLIGRESNARFVSGAARLFLAGTRAFAPGCVVVRSTGAVHLLSVGGAGIPAEVPRSHLYPITWNPGALMGGIVTMPGVAASRRVAVDGLTPLFEQLIATYFIGAELLDGEELLRGVRRVKTSHEIAGIRAAIEVAEAVMASALSAAASGAPDRAIVAIAMDTMARNGVTTAALEPVVRRVDGVTGIDIAVLRSGWEGGFARTEPCVGAPAAHHEAILRCRAGVAVRAVGPDDTTNGVGLGYEVLEPDCELQAGMVVSIATGLARDLVLVTAAEPEVLTTMPYVN